MVTPPPRVRTQIEQAIAFGRSLDWMLDHLHVTTLDVDATLRYLDAVNAETDDDPSAHVLMEPPAGVFWRGRPAESYFGPAAPEVIAELVDAICPPKSARIYRKKAAA